MILLRLAVRARKNVNPTVSFEDLRLPFQDYHCLDLREKGFVVLGTDEVGRPGVALNRMYRGLTAIEFADVVNLAVGKDD